MIDATFAEVPRQRNSQEENLQVKAGETAVEWNQQGNKSVLAQKDLDARWTKKRIKKKKSR